MTELETVKVPLWTLREEAWPKVLLSESYANTVTVVLFQIKKW